MKLSCHNNDETRNGAVLTGLLQWEGCHFITQNTMGFGLSRLAPVQLFVKVFGISDNCYCCDLIETLASFLPWAASPWVFLGWSNAALAFWKTDGGFEWPCENGPPPAPGRLWCFYLSPAGAVNVISMSEHTTKEFNFPLWVENDLGENFFFSTSMVSLFDFWTYFMSTYLFFLEVPFILRFLNQHLTNHYSSQSTFNVYCTGHLYVFPLCIQ